jgi:hypothetical protein
LAQIDNITKYHRKYIEPIRMSLKLSLQFSVAVREFGQYKDDLSTCFNPLPLVETASINLVTVAAGVY